MVGAPRRRSSVISSWPRHWRCGATATASRAPAAGSRRRRCAGRAGSRRRRSAPWSGRSRARPAPAGCRWWPSRRRSAAASRSGRRLAQAADQVGHVGPEDAAVDVQLVEHDEAQAAEEVRPARVLGQDAACSMSGLVKMIEPCGAARARGRPACRRRRRRTSRPGRRPVPAAQLPKARTDPGRAPWWGRGTGRVRCGSRSTSSTGSVVAERLAAGRAGGDDHVLARAQSVFH